MIYSSTILSSQNIAETNSFHIDSLSSNLKLAGIFGNPNHLNNSTNSLQVPDLDINASQSIENEKKTGKTHRIIRYCPKEKDIVYELECEYMECRMLFDNMDLFLEHIDNHLNNYLKEIKEQMTIQSSKKNSL
jgi:hypothetical protein